MPVRFMQMKRLPQRKPIPLFDDRPDCSGDDEALRARLREFAQAVALRHRRSPAGVAEFETALRGYHRTLSICTDRPVPLLSETLVDFARSEYLAIRNHGRSAAA
jgi:hypothetical protein